MAGAGNRSRRKGTEYEQRAAELLEREGYQILHRNFCSRFGEIDLVARQAIIALGRRTRAGIPWKQWAGRSSAASAKRQPITACAMVMGKILPAGSTWWGFLGKKPSMWRMLSLSRDNLADTRTMGEKKGKKGCQYG